MRHVGYALLVGFIALGSGCATMFSGSEQDVEILSVPEGVEVRVDGKPHKTPATVRLLRRRPHVVEFPGGRRVTIASNPTGNGMLVLSALVYGSLGVAIDLVSGAAASLQPGRLGFRDGRVFSLDDETNPVEIPAEGGSAEVAAAPAAGAK